MARPSTARLCDLFQRLRQARADVDDQLAELGSRRAEVLQRAAASHDVALRQLLARQMLLLDRQTRLLQTQQRLTQHQVRLVERLVYAKEQAEIARLLEDSTAGAGVDWLEALVLASASVRGLGRRLHRVNELLAWLEGLVTPLPGPVIGPESEWATVKRVPDGDGAALEDGRRVRYIGIDTPEISSHGRPEPYAQEAKELNQALVVGKQVRLERDRSDTDGYGRLLRYVWAGDLLVNAELVRRGAAFALPIPPDTRHQELFARLEAEARRQRRGLWAT
jgi:endonuclease YncB( thermonuclease family)